MNIVVGKTYASDAYPEYVFEVIYTSQEYVIVRDNNGTEYEFSLPWCRDNFTEVRGTITLDGYLSGDHSAFLSESELKKYLDAGLSPQNMGPKVHAVFTFIEG